MPELYADILLPIAQEPFSYRVADELVDGIEVGRCVRANLGHRKIYIGVVWRLYKERPRYRNIKTIEQYVESAPHISELQRHLWGWLAEYYMCTLGEVMKAALPSALKPSGFSLDEFRRGAYHPPTLQYIALHPTLQDHHELDKELKRLGRAKRQSEALVEICDRLERGANLSTEIPRNTLTAELSVLRRLEQRGAIVITTREIKLGELPPLEVELPTLTPLQHRAKGEIEGLFEEQDVVLLHGVTGSGKTEIYINMIEKQLRAGRNVLYLLPEIAMSTQIVERIKRYFSHRVITYHSAYSERVRVESFRRANLSRGGELILGVRSSLFLPATNLGLVIVDEEHDSSYKNSDRAPRYNARDSAIMLARMAGAKTLLGSATPSLESYLNATTGRYGLVSLGQRYGGTPSPHFTVSDTIRAVKRGERKSHFNKELMDGIELTLSRGEQVMLFQNRRGYSPYIECGECGWVARCVECNVAMTLHKGENRVRCHYCNHSEVAPTLCPDCGRESIETRGFGTEKVEQELSALLPQARIERLDRDVARSVGELRAITSALEQGEIDILVGTQMITKGFDFGGVALVGILNADNLLAYPDFRASERAFQTMTQVGGRAGRRERQGGVIVQSAQPENEIIQQVIVGDYRGMARTQLEERRAFLYPPYCRMVNITLRHRDRDLLWSAANDLNKGMRATFGRRVMGPVAPVVDRVQGLYILNITIKIERGESFRGAKQLLGEMIKRLNDQKQFRSVVIVCDVDPQ